MEIHKPFHFATTSIDNLKIYQILISGIQKYSAQSQTIIFNILLRFQLWEGAMTDLASGSRDNVSLYLNKFQVAAVPSKCSRHNAPAR